MVRVLLYGYATGVYSSRKMEAKTYDDVAFGYLSTDAHTKITGHTNVERSAAPGHDVCEIDTLIRGESVRGRSTGAILKCSAEVHQ